MAKRRKQLLITNVLDALEASISRLLKADRERNPLRSDHNDLMAGTLLKILENSDLKRVEVEMIINRLRLLKFRFSHHEATKRLLNNAARRFVRRRSQKQ